MMLRFAAFTLMTVVVAACGDQPLSPADMAPPQEVQPPLLSTVSSGVGIGAFTVNKSGELWKEQECPKRATWAEGTTPWGDTIWSMKIEKSCSALAETGTEMYNGGTVSVFAVSSAYGSDHVNDMPADFSEADMTLVIPSDGYIYLKTTPKAGCEFASWWIDRGQDYIYTTTLRIYPSSNYSEVWGMFMCDTRDGATDDGSGDDGGDGTDCPPEQVICED